MKFQTILAIDTSCDDTSVAVVRRDFTVAASVVSSQIARHAEFGGVVPGLAAREHEKNLPEVLEKALRDAGLESVAEVDAVAVTVRPGLAIALWRGLNFAQKIAADFGKPLIPVDHLAGHLLSTWLRAPGKSAPDLAFPVAALLASGGHSEFFSVKNGTPPEVKFLGGTRDDAAGEAFDKVARMLGYGWPGAARLCAAAGEFRENPAEFLPGKTGMKNPAGALPLPWLDDHFRRDPARREPARALDFDLSFSGLKTAVRRLILAKNLALEPAAIPPGEEKIRGQIAALFEEIVAEILAEKLISAAEKISAREIHLVGGVSANKFLRQKILEKSRDRLPDAVFRAPAAWDFCTDNAAMIGAAAFFSPAAPDPAAVQARADSDFSRLFHPAG